MTYMSGVPFYTMRM